MSQPIRKPTRKITERSSTLTSSRGTTSNKRAAAPATPRNTAAKRRKQASAPSPPPPAEDQTTESEASEDDDCLPDDSVFIANIATRPRPVNTRNSADDGPTAPPAQSGSQHRPVAIPSGFYNVSLNMGRFLQGETSTLSFEIQNEMRQWTAVKWARLHNPPDYLEIQHFIQRMAKDLTNEDAASIILEANRNLLTARLRTAKYTTIASNDMINQILQYPPTKINSSPTEERCLIQLQTTATQTEALLKKMDDYSSSLHKSRCDADTRLSLQQKSVMSSLTTIATNSTASSASASKLAPTDAGQVMSGVTTRIPPMGSLRPVTAASGSGFSGQASAQGSQNSSKQPMEW